MFNLHKLEKIMIETQIKFENLLLEHGDSRYQNFVRSEDGYSDELINNAFHCYALLVNSDKTSAPRRSYKQWVEMNCPNEKKNPKVFFYYVDKVMSEEVTEVLHNKWLYDRNREISHTIKCRMVILSGLAAMALLE